jgi:transporter family-2 protein
MYSLFSFLLGAFFAIMISINGSLVSAFDSYTGTAIVHLFGLITSAVMLGVMHKKIVLDPKAPKWIYLSGVVGILTTLFQASSFGRISMLSISALGLLGQTTASLFIDSFGLFGMKRHPFERSTLIGFAFAVAGIALMLDATVSTAVIAVLMSFGAGLSIVTARSMNARLAASVGTMQGTMINFLAAFPFTVLLALTLGRHGYTAASFTSVPLWIYLGGILGVAGVAMNNLLVPHLPAFQLTLLSFLGSIAGSLVIDLISGGSYPSRSLLGGLLIAAGMLVNMILSHRAELKNSESAARR